MVGLGRKNLYFLISFAIRPHQPDSTGLQKEWKICWEHFGYFYLWSILIKTRQRHLYRTKLNTELNIVQWLGCWFNFFSLVSKLISSHNFLLIDLQPVLIWIELFSQYFVMLSGLSEADLFSMGLLVQRISPPTNLVTKLIYFT